MVDDFMSQSQIDEHIPVEYEEYTLMELLQMLVDDDIRYSE